MCNTTYLRDAQRRDTGKPFGFADVRMVIGVVLVWLGSFGHDVLGAAPAAPPGGAQPANDGDPFGPQPTPPPTIHPDDVDLENGQELDDLTLLPPDQPRLRRLPGFPDWRSDRTLTEKQKSRVRNLTQMLLDPGKRWRGAAARELGEWGHEEAISPLCQALRDKRSDAYMREQCVLALSKIADMRVIESLIEAIGVGEGSVGWLADRQLRKLTHANWGGARTPDQAEQQKDPEPKPDNRAAWEAWLRRRQERWRQWWKENADKVQLDRSAALRDECVG
jgi:hypothetical protein